MWFFERKRFVVVHVLSDGIPDFPGGAAESDDEEEEEGDEGEEEQGEAEDCDGVVECVVV